MKRYHYIGNPEFIPQDGFPPRTRLKDMGELRTWMEQHAAETDIEGNIAATYIVDPEFHFWFADRGSEHVACAREGEILSAGEVFFTYSGDDVCIDHITNQSTGFCPEPESWPAVKQAIREAGVPCPNGFEPEFVFRRCTKCENRAIVKEDFFVSLICGADLPAEYNLQ